MKSGVLGSRTRTSRCSNRWFGTLPCAMWRAPPPGPTCACAAQPPRVMHHGRDAKRRGTNGRGACFMSLLSEMQKIIENNTHKLKGSTSSNTHHRHHRRSTDQRVCMSCPIFASFALQACPQGSLMIKTPGVNCMWWHRNPQGRKGRSMFAPAGTCHQNSLHLHPAPFARA